jgi:serine/threonine protein kinase
MKYSMRIVEGPGGDAAFDLPLDGTVVMGRSRDTDLRLGDPKVSRRHCRLRIRLPSLTLEDLNSPNGTFLNGRRIEHPEQVLEGDRITIGSTILRVERVGAEEGSEPGFCLCCGNPAQKTCSRCGPQFLITENGIPGITLERRLGGGSMGIVYKGRRKADGMPVAVKILALMAGKADERKLRRFLREALIPGRLDHDAAVKVLDSGVILDSGAAREESGIEQAKAAFIVHDFIEGSNLKTLVKENGPMDVKTAVHCAVSIAEVLAKAGELGIVHRDIKPENIMVTAEGGVKVTDFGLAKSFGEAGLSNITVSGKAFGTPAFMPPEQVMDSKYVGQSSDIYSLGATLFYLLAGHAPFTGKGVSEVLKKVLNDPPPRLSELRPDIPEELCEVVTRCLAKQTSERYSFAKDLMADLAKTRKSL